MPLTYDEIARATLRISCCGQSGSGFHFLRPDIVATSYHVVEDDPHVAEAFAEDGTRWGLELLTHSLAEDDDFALYRIRSRVRRDRVALLPPGPPRLPDLGCPIRFSGFPHGIADLLIQQGSVAGYDPEADGFYIDASVNGGNSGGPAIDGKSGQIVGQVYASHFLGSADVAGLSAQAEQLAARLAAAAETGARIVVSGINYAATAALAAESSRILARALQAKANTGIGIAREIAVLTAACEDEGIDA